MGQNTKSSFTVNITAGKPCEILVLQGVFEHLSQKKEEVPRLQGLQILLEGRVPLGRLADHSDCSREIYHQILLHPIFGTEYCCPRKLQFTSCSCPPATLDSSE